jgi:hypothetical protein
MSTVSEAKPAHPVKYETFAEEQLTRARHRIRFLDLFAAGLGLLIATLAYGLVMAVLDRAFGLPPVFRQAAFTCYLLSVLAYLGGTVVIPLCRRINPYFAAQQVEHALPGAKNSVVNWLDLRDQELPAAISRAVTHRAAKDLARADLEQAISARRAGWLGGVLFGLFLGLLVLFFLGPRQFYSLMGRAFAPFVEAPIATRTFIRVTEPQGGNASVPVGHAASIVAEVDGKIPHPTSPDALKLLYRYQLSDAYEEKLLEPGENSQQWRANVSATEVHNGFWYKLTGGDTETPEYRVQVRSTPLLTDFAVTCHFRPYVRRADETSRDPNLEGLRGTDVTLVARANREIQDATLNISGETPNPAELPSDDRHAMRFHFTLEKDATYQIWFTSVEGEKNTDPMPYTIRVLRDQTPTVELTQPGKDISLPANGRLKLEGPVEDDYGIASVILKLQLDSLQLRPYRKDKLKGEDGTDPKRVDYKDSVPLDQILHRDGQPLRPGMVIEYWLEATDNCDYPEPNVGKSRRFKLKITEPVADQQKREDDANRQGQQQQESKTAQESGNQEEPQSGKDQQQANPKPSDSGKDQQQANQKPSDEETNQDKKLQDQAEKLQRALDEDKQNNPAKDQDSKPSKENGSRTKGDQDNRRNDQDKEKGDQGKGEQVSGKNDSADRKPDQGTDQQKDNNAESKADQKSGERSERTNDKTKAESKSNQGEGGQTGGEGDQAGDKRASTQKGGQNKGDPQNHGDSKDGQNKTGPNDRKDDKSKADSKSSANKEEEKNDKAPQTKDKQAGGQKSDKANGDQRSNGDAKGAENSEKPDHRNGEKRNADSKPNQSDSDQNRAKGDQAQNQRTDGVKGNQAKKEEESDKGQKSDTQAKGDGSGSDKNSEKAGQKSSGNAAKGEQSKGGNSQSNPGTDRPNQDEPKTEGQKGEKGNGASGNSTAQQSNKGDKGVSKNDQAGSNPKDKQSGDGKDQKSERTQEGAKGEDGKSGPQQPNKGNQAGSQDNRDQAGNHTNNKDKSASGERAEEKGQAQQGADKADADQRNERNKGSKRTGQAGSDRDGDKKSDRADRSQNQSGKEQKEATGNQAADKGKSNKEAKSKQTAGGQGGDQDKRGGSQPSQNGREKNADQHNGENANERNSGRKPDQREIENLIQDLENGNASVRRDAARRLSEAKNRIDDPKLREAAEKALQKSERRENSSAAQPEGNSQDQGERTDTQKPGEKPTGQNKMKDGNGEKKDPRQSDRNQQGESGGKGQDDPSQPTHEGQRNPGAGRTGSRQGTEAVDSNRPAPQGDKADAQFQKRAGALQLDDLKKKVNKNVLKKANMTEEEYQQFLKAYQKMLQRKQAEPGGEEKLTDPKAASRGLRSMKSRASSNGKGKADDVSHGDTSLAPPEFREAYQEFTRKLSSLERAREVQKSGDR